MIILTIKQPGLYIRLPGIPPFRTPAKVDITKMNMNILEAELKRSGVEEYEIKKKAGFKVRKQVVDDTPHPQIDPTEKLSGRLDNIEDLLKKVLEKDPTIIQQYVSDEKQTGKKKIEVDDEDTFIPEINIDGIKGSINHETTLGESDTDETADLLRQMTKGKKK